MVSAPATPWFCEMPLGRESTWSPLLGCGEPATPTFSCWRSGVHWVLLQAQPSSEEASQCLGGMESPFSSLDSASMVDRTPQALQGSGAQLWHPPGGCHTLLCPAWLQEPQGHGRSSKCPHNDLVIEAMRAVTVVRVVCGH